MMMSGHFLYNENVMQETTFFIFFVTICAKTYVLKSEKIYSECAIILFIPSTDMYIHGDFGKYRPSLYDFGGHSTYHNIMCRVEC